MRKPAACATCSSSGMSRSGFKWSDLRRCSCRRSIRPHRSSCCASALIHRRPTCDPGVLPHVRVHEQPASRRQHARRFAEHAPQRLWREVLEHVERARFGERAVGERQLAEIADQQIDIAPRLGREIRTDVDADRRRSPVAVPQQRPAAAAAQIDDEIVRLGSEKCPQHVVADFRSEQRRRQAFVPGVGMQRLVQILRSARRTRPAAGDQDSRALLLWYGRPHPRHTSASRVPASAPWQSGQRTSARRASEIIQRSRPSRRSTLRAAPRADPRSTRRRGQRGSRQAGRERAIGEQPLDRRRHRLVIAGQARATHQPRGAGPRESTADPTRRLAGPPPCTRTASTAT